MADNLQEIIKCVTNLQEAKTLRDEKISQLSVQLAKEKEYFAQGTQQIEGLLETLRNKLEELEERKTNLRNILDFNLSGCQGSMKKNKKKDDLPYKKFHFRESMLTDLMKTANYKTIYNIFFSFLILFILMAIVEAYLLQGKNTQNQMRLLASILEMEGVMKIIVYFFLKIVISITVVICLNIVKKQESLLFCVIFGTLGYLIIFNRIFDTQGWSFCVKALHYWDNATFLLKMFAYYCEKKLMISYQLAGNESRPNDEKRVLILEDNGESDSIIFKFENVNIMKEIKSYLLFYLYPTLIYRDAYPMNKYVNYSAAFVHLMNSIMCFLFIFLMSKIYLSEFFADEGLSFLQTDKIIKSFVNFILTSIILFFVIFFAATHSYSNLTSELYGFGDRDFYKGFFHSRTPAKFLSNVFSVYDDFFKYYIKPTVDGKILTTMFFFQNSDIFKQMTYEISKICFYCVFFEYIVLSSMGTSCPVISVVIIFSHLISYPLSTTKSRKLMLFNWLIISIGVGMVLRINSTEYVLLNSSGSHEYSDLTWIGKMIPKIFLHIFK